MKNLILVTGATGFIGCHLIKTLVRNGERIRCLALAKSNTADLKRLDVEIVYGDLLDKALLQEVVKNTGRSHQSLGYRRRRKFTQGSNFYPRRLPTLNRLNIGLDGGSILLF